ncbi:MAG: hypothetical protein ACE5OZ_12240 [Candidatus Heimdallarchaeota archaeon]
MSKTEEEVKILKEENKAIYEVVEEIVNQLTEIKAKLEELEQTPRPE